LVLTGTVLLGGAQAPAPAQAPTPAPAAAVTLVGEAAPPPSPLSLWYREPAADRPLVPRPTGRGATADWVRALPVGNGRIGAMVFGGVVNERLQLNEDTLWAGRP
jgi:alpha-L-fucosidase 2